MRHYADELRSAGFTVHYHQLDPASVSFQDQLHSWLQRLAVTELWHFEIETKPLQSRLRRAFCGTQCDPKRDPIADVLMQSPGVRELR
ncbi:MAG: hypothetical protein CM15mP120_28440 [Pseudomonadota bacterium]|nr:MAG: hypothetical protein CM15mP120_28440 [Pseudomonadota bacterium]